MGRHRRGAVLAVTAIVAAIAGYGYAVSGTRPFTAPADALTAVAFGAGALAFARGVVRRHAGAPVASSERVYLPWVLVVGAFCVWELVTYVAGLSGARHAYPTISSLVDSAFRWRGAKAAVFVAWAAVGWGVVRR